MSDLNSEITEWIAIAKGDKCPLCKGTGSIRGGHVTCPKCGGKKVAKDANESLATVMRHDQDHDNWHKMHGDAPCTSEADCAQKRAKYAEVQAEQVTKGDVVGHVFHGNQWEKADRLVDSLMSSSDGNFRVNGGKVSQRHDEMAEAHENDAKAYAKMARGEKDPQKLEALKKAIAMHKSAAEAHKKASSHWKNIGPVFAHNESVDVSIDAASASSNASKQDKRVNKLTKSFSLAKGDTPGHAFHGNQYTEARKLNDTLKIANNMHLQHSEGADPESVSAEHEIAAALHRGMSSDLRGLAQHALDTGHPITSSALRHAAELHTTAAQAHEEAAKVTDEQGVGQRSVDAAFPAVRASREATQATDQALDMAQDTGAAPVPRLSF